MANRSKPRQTAPRSGPHSLEDALTLGDRSVPYTVYRSARRKRTVQISVAPDETIVVQAPMRLAKARIDELVRARARWIRQRLAEMARSRESRMERQWRSGEKLPLLGEEVELRISDAPGERRVRVDLRGRYLEVAAPLALEGAQATIPKAVLRWYGLQSLRLFQERTDVFARELGVQPKAVLVRNQERRWGSCSRDGTLRFCWRLIMAPMRIIDYVVVHELAHMRHPHHQAPFWDCVGRLQPNYALLRTELRREGERYRL